MSKQLVRYEPIPPQVIPDDTVCITIKVPNDPNWLSAFWWIMRLYGYWFSWKKTTDKRGRLVAARWREMFYQAHEQYSMGIPCEKISIGGTGLILGDVMSQQIRISPDDSCIIQMWCIDHWENWYDPRGCVPGLIVQPGDGGTLNPGECNEYDATLLANGKWLLPVQVSAGDTIEISNVSGGWNDGGVTWHCPNGLTYLLGACANATPAQPGDPLQSVNHMRLITEINGTFYDGFNTLIAVPSGVTNQNMVFQANDGTLSNNNGSITFHVKVCRGQQNISLSYLAGSGPSVIVPGQQIVMNSDNGSFLQCQNIYNLTFLVNPCSLITVHSLTGWSLFHCLDGNSVYDYYDCSNTQHHFTVPPTTQVPLPLTQNMVRMGILSKTPFSAVVSVA